MRKWFQSFRSRTYYREKPSNSSSYVFLGHPLYGDIKYGAKRNGRQDYQALCAYKVNFHTENNSILSYLDGKEFMLQDTGVEKIYKNL